MSGTNYRVDRVRYLGTPNPRTMTLAVPCGMTSIIYLDDKPPSISRVLESLSKPLAPDEWLLFSKWIGRNGMRLTGEYVVSQVIGASVSNGAVVSVSKAKDRLCPECRDVMIPATKSCCSFCVPGEGPVATKTAAN